MQQNNLWYKDAIIYETHVRAFYDSNNDGVGDFRGLHEKLDYLQSLGITAIWLLPFYPSPLRDDGYDIADYTDVHPAYGTLDDFKSFLHEAHMRGMRVITELVLNHTSDQHRWFQRARHAEPGSMERNFYVWSDTPERYQDARVIFQDFEVSNWSWDSVANAYYWHRFYSHQPDLNFDNPAVRKAMLDVVDFWLALGVDGLRLDAVPYLFEQEGTTGENLPKTHVALRRLRQHIDETFSNRMLLAEANQWPEDAVAYFGNGDECHMCFHFPLMPRLFMAARMEDRFPIIDIMDQTPDIPETAQWALFLRNHDELTLEMVTDEERLYMYQIYAHNPEARINLGIRRRLAPLLGNNRRKIELMNALLLSLPGTPVLYYGDELGMGDNVYLGDRDAVRTPMQWSADRNAGFSRANPQQLYLPLITDPEYYYETINVEAQANNSSSLLAWMRRLIALRKRYQAFGRGTIAFLNPGNRKVLAFIRRYEDEQILVVANLSRFAQHVELDLQAFNGQTPVEAFGRTRFPPIGELPYLMTLGPHAFYWFALEPQQDASSVTSAHAQPFPTLSFTGEWQEMLQGDIRTALENVLPRYLHAQSWFFSKAHTVLATRIVETIPVATDDDPAFLLLVEVEYADSEPNTVLVPLACASGPDAQHLINARPEAVLAQLRPTGSNDEPCVLYDAVWTAPLPKALLNHIMAQEPLTASNGTLTAIAIRHSEPSSNGNVAKVETLIGAHNNAVVMYGEQCVLKLFRNVGMGINPEFEIGQFLNEHHFANVPQVMGALEYRNASGVPMTLAVVQAFVPNNGEAWQSTQTMLQSFLERAKSIDNATVDAAASMPFRAARLLRLAEQTPPAALRDLTGDFFDRARLLGQRTAEMHIVLADHTSNPAFEPEPFTSLYQRSIYQSMRSLTGRIMFSLQHDLARLPEAVHADAQKLVAYHDTLLTRFKAVTAQKIDAQRIRCHGNYHLGQVLATGDDFVIFDFEGEPSRSVIERQLKHSPLRDVAGMLHSLDHAAQVALQQFDEANGHSAQVQRWARAWSRRACAALLKGYCDTTCDWDVLPRNSDHVALLLDVFVLEKTIYEIGHAIEQHPQRLQLAFHKALALLKPQPPNEFGV